MKNILSSITLVAVAAASSVLSTNVMAEAPELKTKSPFIYLADNLDEKDKLGYCIDTVGAGFNEKLHAHSCKPPRGSDTDPKGNDIKFTFDEKTGQIASHIFDNKCIDLNDAKNKNTPFGLVDCSSNESQKFAYNKENGQIQIASDASMCVAVEPESRSAGPFMSRDLIVAKCDSVDKKLSTWKIKADV